MPALARMMSAKEYFTYEQARALNKREMDPEDYMDFAERYADYVCDHEKFIDRTGLSKVEELENEQFKRRVNA